MFVRVNIFVTCTYRLRCKGNQTPQNPSEQPHTGGFDNSGVSVDANPVPDTNVYETPEQTPTNGRYMNSLIRCDICMPNDMLIFIYLNIYIYIDRYTVPLAYTRADTWPTEL